MLHRKSTTARFTTIILIVLSVLAINAGSVLAEDSLTVVSQNNDEVVYIDPGDDVQSIVDRHPSGTTFVLRAGIHRLQSIRPRNGDTYIGETGAVLSGARVLTDFQREGNLWVATGQTQQNYVLPPPMQMCQDGFGRCHYPEDLFFDNQPLRHVTSRNQVAPGSWYFDYANDRIYFADDPNGHLVETSVVPHAFTAHGSNVTIRNLTVEKYASPVFRPAIYTGNNWVIDGVTAQLNHSAGIKLEDGAVITNSRAIYNGQIGMQGVGNNYILEGNEIAYNNWANFYLYFEAGGVKFARASNVTVRNNYVHNNNGVGLWVDIDNRNFVIENNITFNNVRHGIYYEISYDGIIRNNIAKFNNPGDHWALIGGQIRVENSSNVEVYGNTVVIAEDVGNGIAVTNGDRGNGAYGPWRSYNVNVYNNTIIHMADTGRSGVQPRSVNYDTYWRESNNSFNRNTYYVRSNPDGEYWYWRESNRTFSEMQQRFGQERNGVVNVGIPSDAAIIPAWGNSLISYTESTIDHNEHILNLTVVDAESGMPLTQLENDMVLDMTALGTSAINVRANAAGEPASVQFVLGDQVSTENLSPFMMWGDDGRWAPADGTYTLIVTPFDGADNSGFQGNPYVVSFRVANGGDNSGVISSDEPPVVEAPTPEPEPQPEPEPDGEFTVDGFSLVNADTGETIMALADGDEINLAQLPSRNLNMIAETSGDVGSVTISVNDGTARLENNAPYAVWGDENNTYVAWTPSNDSYTIAATPYSASYAGGTSGETTQITVTFIDDMVIDNPSIVPEPEIEQLVLVNADTSQPIMTLSDGMEIDLATLPSRNLNIKAETNSDVNSVMMSLNQSSRMENVEPFALWGDTFWREEDGGYNAWTPTAGTYTFEAIPYSESSGRGEAGQSVSYRVTFVSTAPEPTDTPPQDDDDPQVDNDDMTVTGLRLINADTNQPIMMLQDGQRIDIDGLPTRNLNVEAVTSGAVESVRVEVNNASRLENAAPYAVWGDRSGDYTAWTPQIRSYSFRAVPYSSNNARGSAGDAYSLTITFEREIPDDTPVPTVQAPPQVDNDLAVTGFTLINADTNQPIMTLTNGQTIDLATLPTRNLNMQVLTSGNVESVRVSYDSTTRVENGEPYSVWGDMNANYTSWTPQLRAYNVSATPFGRDNAGGQSGMASSITVTFVEQQQAPPQSPPVVNNPPVDNGNNPPPVNDGNNPPENNEGNQPIVIPDNGLTVTGFTLINADNDQPIMALAPGAVIDLATLPTRNLNMRADVSGEVRSMTLTVGDRVQQEAAPPFSVWGDEPVGDYEAWNPAPGQYTVTAMPYAGPNQTGQTGTPMSLTFTVVEGTSGANAVQRSGLNVEIYNQQNLSGTMVARQDGVVDFNWGEGAPASGIDPDSFSIRWTGWIVPEHTETYTFYTFADDGTRLWINDTLVIDDWSDHAAREASGSINLQAGQSYTIRLEYYDSQRSAQVSLSWSSPSVPQAVIPSQNLFTVDPGNNANIAVPEQSGEIIVIGQ